MPRVSAVSRQPEAAAGDVEAYAKAPMSTSLVMIGPTLEGPSGADVWRRATQVVEGVTSALLKLPLICLASLAVSWQAIRLLAVLYLTYGCMHLAPTTNLRRWGTTTWWQLSQESPESLWKGYRPNDSPVIVASAPFRLRNGQRHTTVQDQTSSEQRRAA